MSKCCRRDDAHGDKGFQGSQPLSLRSVKAAPNKGTAHVSKLSVLIACCAALQCSMVYRLSQGCACCAESLAVDADKTDGVTDLAAIFSSPQVQLGHLIMPSMTP